MHSFLERSDLTDLDGVVGGGPNAIVRAYAANPAFRAAQWSELTTEDDPYRRPVRPDDLAWLDYSVPMPAEGAMLLSALLGHRMLRTIHDAGQLHLPASPNESALAEEPRVHSIRSRVLGALARPVLEEHLFTLLDTGREALGTPTVAGLTTLVADEFECRAGTPVEAFAAVGRARDRRAAVTFLLVQLSAYLPTVHVAAGRAGLGDYDRAHPDLRGLLLGIQQDWHARGAAWAALLAAASMVRGAGAYWQLYLGSSLARGNLLLRAGSEPERVAELCGALVHELLDRSTTAAALGDLVRDELGAGAAAFFDPLAEPGPARLTRLTEQLVGPLTVSVGESAVHGFHRGFADARAMARLWRRDLAEQIEWADSIEIHQKKAAEIDDHLTLEGIEVDLDTFVESNEETSTTHVHDEHRLVMIESGRMHFWNNITHRIELGAGDKLLIPVARLHGSTVLSGSCTYHQPIIPAELLARFD